MLLNIIISSLCSTIVFISFSKVASIALSFISWFKSSNICSALMVNFRSISSISWRSSLNSGISANLRWHWRVVLIVQSNSTKLLLLASFIMSYNTLSFSYHFCSISLHRWSTRNLSSMVSNFYLSSSINNSTSL